MQLLAAVPFISASCKLSKNISGTLPKKTTLTFGLIYRREVLKFIWFSLHHKKMNQATAYLWFWWICVKYNLQLKVMCIFTVTWIGTSLNISPVQGKALYRGMCAFIRPHCLTASDKQVLKWSIVYRQVLHLNSPIQSNAASIIKRMDDNCSVPCRNVPNIIGGQHLNEYF